MIIELFAISALLSVMGAVVSLVLSWDGAKSKVVACAFGLFASLASFASGAGAIAGAPISLRLSTVFPFADLSLRWDPLSGLLVCVISVLAFAAWLYGFSYFDEYREKGIGKLGFYMNLFVASMNGVVLADNAFWFLVMFELMSLTSYFLVVFDQTEKSIRGGFLYFVMAHIGFMMIMIAFLIMASTTGSFEFESFRATEFSGPIASAVFLLAFLGFGIKAGMFPFHSWLPQAHPAAPSNVSALMSGAMVKIGVFGVVKVAFDLLASSPCELWWGLVVLAIGAASSVIGIAYATAEGDIKRVLAYCTVENVGIIFVAVGVSLVGAAMEQPVVAFLGMTGALFHVANHALFKGALFLGAGSIIYRVHTRALDAMGGLAKAMPATALFFLAGCVAVCAIPPLNGFASEWLIYQSLIDAAMLSERLVQGFAVVAAALLAVTGALAVMCFVKVYGVAFSGTARSPQAAQATKAPATMTLATALLVVLCFFFGIGSAFVLPAFEGMASYLLSFTAGAASGASLVNPATGGSVSLLLFAVLLTVACLLAQAIRHLARRRGGAAERQEPWDCGYLPDASMVPSSGTFAAYANEVVAPLYSARALCVARLPWIRHAYESFVGLLTKLEPLADKYLVDGIIALTNKMSALAERVEDGNYRHYIAYIVGALVILLIAVVVLG